MFYKIFLHLPQIKKTMYNHSSIYNMQSKKTNVKANAGPA